MKELKRIPLTKLRNIEITILINDVLQVLERHDLEKLHLQAEYDIIKMHQPNAQKLSYPTAKHLLTYELDRLHKRRVTYAMIINSHVKALLNSDVPELQQKALFAQRYSSKYLTYLNQRGRKFTDLQLHMFLLNVNAQPAELEGSVKHAYVSLGLGHFISELDKANEDYFIVYEKRREDLKKKSRKEFPTIRRELLWILRLFIERVNSFQNMYKNVDYSLLIRELNIHLTANSKRVKTRMAKNKRKALENTEAEKSSAEQKENTQAEKNVATQKDKEKAEVTTKAKANAQPTSKNNKGPTAQASAKRDKRAATKVSQQSSAKHSSRRDKTLNAKGLKNVLKSRGG